jgi:hypothetical protein
MLPKLSSANSQAELQYATIAGWLSNCATISAADLGMLTGYVRSDSRAAKSFSRQARGSMIVVKLATGLYMLNGFDASLGPILIKVGTPYEK